MRCGKIEITRWIENFYDLFESLQKGEGIDVNLILKNGVIFKCGCKLVIQQVGVESIFICQFSLPQLLVQNALVQARRNTKTEAEVVSDSDFQDESKLTIVSGLPGNEFGPRRSRRIGSEAPLLQNEVVFIKTNF